MFQDMCVSIYLPPVSIHPLFQCCSVFCSRLMKELVAGSMQEHVIGIGAELFVTGEESLEMYFINKGHCWYNFMREHNIRGSKESSMKVKVAFGTDISWACELSLYVKWRHTGIMDATQVCELIKLNAADFSKKMRSEIVVHKYARSLMGFLRQYPDQQSDVMNVNIVHEAFDQSRW
mmetsp:Transcript_120145/g.218356  ORF Transcript_120145/g.218356 Transcript_120145/m.218356 type:complete len:177 (-) Transcript_120145:24-554(-)